MVGDKEYVDFLNSCGIKHPFEEGFSIVAEESEFTWPSKRFILGVWVEVFEERVEICFERGKEWETVAILEVLMGGVWYYNEDFRDLNAVEIMGKVINLKSGKITLVNDNGFAYDYVRSLLFYIINNDYPDDYFKKREIEKVKEIRGVG